MHLLRGAALLIVVGGAVGCDGPFGGGTSDGWRVSSGFQPLSDSDALAQVVSAPETRPDNAVPNAYVPTADELAAFLAAKDTYGNDNPSSNPYTTSVTGGCGGTGRTTDEIIQCTAAKWGIPADWLRAEYVVESSWEQIDPSTGQPCLGDKTDVGVTDAAAYPSFSQERDAQGNLTGNVWQSVGLTQVRWTSTGSVGPGTDPLRWKSTAFNADFQAATVRFYYDDPKGLRTAWGDPYTSGEDWLSIGGWYNPYPWNNSGQQDYVAQVQKQLAARTWAQKDF